MIDIHKLSDSKKTFQKYYEHFEEFLDDKVLDIESSRSKLYKMYANPWDYSDDEIEELDYYINTNSYEFDAEFRLNFRNSFVIQLYSFLENTLRNYCIKHCIINKKEYSINDIKGNNDIDKIKKYLKNSASKDISDDKELWEFINNFRKLRNKIVHNEGILNYNDGDLNSLNKFSVNRFIIIEKNINEDKYYKILLINKEFIDESLEKIFEFIIKLI